MMRIAVLVALSSGCAIGGSSSVVGRWRGGRVVDSTACVKNNAPGADCERVITIGRDIPPREFTTMTFTFAAPGYAQQRGGADGVGHGLALNGQLEYLYGRGGLAIGGRIGGNVLTGFGDRFFFLMPVSAVAHLGDLWGSVYVGAGYSPVALEQQYTGEGEMRMALPATYHHNSFHVFAGTRFWILRNLERGLTLDPEVRVETFGDSQLYSMTANIGIHL
jgi:hypothetical protein